MDERVPSIAPEKFSSPEEEIAFLRQRIADREREVAERNREADPVDYETVGKQELHEYGTFTPQSVLAAEQVMAEPAVTAAAERVDKATDKVAEIITLAETEGIKNALSVMEKVGDGYIVDEVHRQLIEHIKGGRSIQDLKEGVPPWHVLHMTLFEVALPQYKADEEAHKSLTELVALMEQFYAGMQGVGYGKGKDHYTIELAVANESDDIILYVAVPNEFIDLFEKQILSLFPKAVVTEQQHDYNIFVESGIHLVSEARLSKHPVYPLRTDDNFDNDPLTVLLNAFSKIERDGGGAALQLTVKSTATRYTDRYAGIIDRARKGMSKHEAIQRESLGGEVVAAMKGVVFGSKKEDDDHYRNDNSEATELWQQKIEQPIVECNVRLAVSAEREHRAKQILHEIESTFNQFERTQSNRLTWVRPTRAALKRALKTFSFREWDKKSLLPLSFTELATMVHFPSDGLDSSPQFKQTSAKTAAAPTDMPSTGTLLGVNKHRGVEKDIFVTESDRMRHFYIIGQTGTGKSVFMKNLIVQDIAAGHGVCMIDPHGTDIEDVLASVPREREGDIIYFDPSNLEHVIGLNMLEYDPQKPEQKTFVVNELFSIFQKLYGANPESMGPMFEQYFRNATLLVMEDPESGNTLMDISRVMSDARYRRQKLEKATNPVVVQFWREIATKAGGEASLENIVPYIVSKFDVFTANDYMRPIIGQQESTFNFRQIMDERKILLVNLAKGRLGEINANLIGMIVVGKILMAALSRVDTPSMDFAPFFLHIDEFQNVSTPSIASILSEARKYKLGLTIAHQFIAQLDEAIKDAVFGNVGSMTAFRVGPEDGEFLAHQFEPVFDSRDLINVPNYNAYARILANGTPTRPFSLAAMPPPTLDLARVPALITKSLKQYGRPRTEIEAEINERYKKPEQPKDLLNIA
ncbi:hypothetical protein CL655_02610 [bacterium]|nr:hypothetical protein [bacterium]